MNEVAGLDLCKELYELSGWKTGQVERDNPTQSAYNDSNVICYRYSLGYLLRKLPYNGRVGGHKEFWQAVCSGYQVNGTTPEDALCGLAIELFKQKILTKGTI